MANNISMDNIIIVVVVVNFMIVAMVSIPNIVYS